MSDSKYRLCVFGGLTLVDATGSATGLGNQRKKLAFLAALAVGGNRGMSRDRLLALFWPESDIDRARNSLNQFAHGVRRELGEDALVGTSEELRLNAAVIGSDLGDFRAAIASGAPEQAALAYAGPFLDGVYLRDVSDFDRWVAEKRGSLAQEYGHALESAVNRATAGRQDLDAVRWARLLVQHDPLSTRYALHLMNALDQAGDAPAAIRHAELHAAHVQAELEAAPDPALDVEVARIRAGGTTARMRVIVPDESHAAALPDESRGARPPDQFAAPTARSPEKRQLAPAIHVLVVAATLLVVVLTRLRAPAEDLVFTLWRQIGSGPNEAEFSNASLPLVVIAPIENTTGDTALAAIGRVAAAVIADAITRTGIVGAVDAATSLNPSRDGTRPAFSPAVLSDLARVAKARAVVTAIFYRAGDSLEFRASIANGNGARIVSTIEPIRTSKDAPDLKGLAERVTGALASVIDERVAILRNEASQPPRFEAYREYIEGLDYFVGKRSARFDYPGAMQHFIRAAQLDTMFNLPLIWLAFSYGNSFGMARQRDSVIDVLATRRERLAPLDLYALEYFLARGDDEARYRWTTAASELAPLSNWTYLRGVEASLRYRNDEATAAFQRLDAEGSWIRNWTIYWERYTTALHDAGRFDDELIVARKSLKYSPDPWSLWGVMRAHATRGDVIALNRMADSMMMTAPKPLSARWMPAFNRAAAEAFVHGHPQAGAQFAQRCQTELPKHPPDPLHPNDPEEVARFTDQLAECAYLLRDWRIADSLAAINLGAENLYGAFAAIRLVLSAHHRGDTATKRKRLADAYARPEFARERQMRLFLDGLLASLAGDASGTALNLGRIPTQSGPGRNRNPWHTWPDITPAIRQSAEMRRLTIAR